MLRTPCIFNYVKLHELQKVHLETQSQLSSWSLLKLNGSHLSFMIANFIKFFILQSVNEVHQRENLYHQLIKPKLINMQSFIQCLLSWSCKLLIAQESWVIAKKIFPRSVRLQIAFESRAYSRFFDKAPSNTVLLCF